MKRGAATTSQALERLPAPVLITDEAGAIVYANRAAARLHHATRERLLGAPVDGVLAPLGELRARASGEGARGELARRGGDGATRTLGYALASWCEGGREFTAVLHQPADGGEEIRAQRDRLLQLAAVGEVLPSVLHELRNPLAAVTTTVELLVEEAPAELQQDLHAVLGELRRIGLGLQGIGGLNQRVHCHAHEAIDLAVEEACHVLTPSARAVGVELRAEVEVMPLLPLNRAVVKGVVFNLVRNAIDACRPGDGALVTARVDGGSFELAVHDTGRGMAPEVLARCRELFFTSKPNGSGIGLAICHEVVERARGSLTITSEPGLGTTVLVRIPLAAPGDAPCRESTT